jgi:hypothetical protein
MGARWFHQGGRGAACQHLIVGCVDTHSGRREIAKTVAAFHGRLGPGLRQRAYHTARCSSATRPTSNQIKTSTLGLCSGLPSPYLQEPGLLEPEPEKPTLSCAGMGWPDEQSLMVNRLAAAIAAQYVTDFVLQPAGDPDGHHLQSGADGHDAAAHHQPKTCGYGQTDQPFRH